MTGRKQKHGQCQNNRQRLEWFSHPQNKTTRTGRNSNDIQKDGRSPLSETDTKPDGAGLEKEKRSQDDERMIEPEARRKTKVRNTIVCKADIRRKKKEERTTKGRGFTEATGYRS